MTTTIWSRPFLDAVIALFNPVGLMHAVVLVHGKLKKSVGKDLLEVKDPDGKDFTKACVELASGKGNSGSHIIVTDPVTRETAAQGSVLRSLPDAMVRAGG